MKPTLPLSCALTALLAAAPALAYFVCPDERASPPETEPASFGVTNHSPADVYLFWLDADGQRQFQATIYAGGYHLQQTWFGHVWVATTVYEDCLATFVGELDHVDYDVW
ncbi:hypothetical protein [Nannocystis bainbridge]|uniref:von Hippel-Lindau disease tumour suppressor beta domain-containing protein n=1 Tax=Nannocystis bainbridge TaxID=2995303 RepID=A0ABT5E6A4_9BACT|nr:hypothetical protein [Nannocystis bainbridge]MDC0721392.1 hypothetical protein [Nannocystis bainbridge]